MTPQKNASGGGSVVSKRQVKIRRVFAKKRFLEKALFDWKESTEDRNFRSVLFRAHANLKSYPLQINTVGDLKCVKGVGDHIALKLEAAWNNLCSVRLGIPSLKEVQELKKGETMAYLQSGDVRAVSSEGNCEDQPTVRLPPEAPKKRVAAVKRTESDKRDGESPEVRAAGDCVSPKKPKSCANVQKEPQLHSAASTGAQTSSSSLPLARCNIEPQLFYSPSQFSDSQVVLLVDNRENHGGRKKKTTCDYFVKKGVCFDMRSLSVGDYLWILRMKDGSEMVLDYVVERKTLDDLSHSIRQGRYEEQKQRLRSIGLAHVVYLVEGGTNSDPALDQAVVTTQISNGFLVHRTRNSLESSQFLCSITDRLIQKAKRENLSGMSYECFQRTSKKTQRQSVSDLFMEQLTVCPQMSITRSSLVVDRFPSFSALASLYSQTAHEKRAELLSESLPGVPKALSAQLSHFFQHL